MVEKPETVRNEVDQSTAERVQLLNQNDMSNWGGLDDTEQHMNVMPPIRSEPQGHHPHIGETSESEMLTSSATK
jgi:hypothetical protein